MPNEERVKLRPPPSMISVHFGGAWNVVTPSVFRYEDKQWIDEFFASGKLRLSTFAKFATYPDEVRGDRAEGWGMCYGETPDNKSVFMVQQQGISAAVLCCSHRLSAELRQAFQRTSAFQITNTIQFSLEISRQLAGFRHGMEGSCIYRSDATISRAIDLDLSKYKLPDGSISDQMIADAGHQLGGPELLLLKRKRYENQQEYRFLWHVDAIDAEHVDIVAPLARQYCRRVETEEWG